MGRDRGRASVNAGLRQLVLVGDGERAEGTPRLDDLCPADDRARGEGHEGDSNQRTPVAGRHISGQKRLEIVALCGGSRHALIRQPISVGAQDLDGIQPQRTVRGHHAGHQRHQGECGRNRGERQRI
jgi:hypothetical protein